MHIASKLRLNFNITTLTFADTYPEEELSAVITREEFTTIMHRINVEMAHDLHENSKDIRRWFKIVGISSIFLVGILLLPVLLHKSGRQTKLLTRFQENVKEYLYRLNKKKYLKRRIEWKLIKEDHSSTSATSSALAFASKNQRRSRVDAINPASQLRLEVIYESDASRMLNRRITILRTRHQGIPAGSTTSFTGMNTPTPPSSELDNYSEMTPSPTYQPSTTDYATTVDPKIKSDDQRPAHNNAKEHVSIIEPLNSTVQKRKYPKASEYGNDSATLTVNKSTEQEIPKDIFDPNSVLLDKHNILKEVLVSSRRKPRPST